jgi:hypothetical protein
VKILKEIEKLTGGKKIEGDPSLLTGKNWKH